MPRFLQLVALSLARLRRALAAAWPAGIVLAMGCLAHGGVGPTVVVPAIGLSVAIVVLTGRGMSWERVITPALTVGAVTLVGPAVLAAPCTIVCGAVGFTSGTGTGVMEIKLTPAVLTVLAPIGAVACGSMTVVGAAAMASGLVVGRLVSSCADALDRI